MSVDDHNDEMLAGQARAPSGRGLPPSVAHEIKNPLHGTAARERHRSQAPPLAAREKPHEAESQWNRVRNLSSYRVALKIHKNTERNSAP
jgi:nitrogen-specific signal transduction histidine kinase